MPSWNIHIAHVERLLREHGAERLGIADENEFLFGNVVPDVYVGYMVRDASCRIDYKLTHLAEREQIPLPDYDRFWRHYVENPQGYGAARTSDLVLGAWCHLVCDHVYNAHTRRFLAARGLHASERARVAKQGDFADFGRTLDISRVPEATDALIASCAAFPMYSVAARDVRAACAVAGKIVEENRMYHVEGEPGYRLLTREFFEEASAEADAVMSGALLMRAAGR